MEPHRVARVEGSAAAVGALGDAGVTEPWTRDPWADAAPLAVDTAPWPDDGAPLSAALWLVYDDAALSLCYRVHDDHVQATSRPPNGAVWLDSCVELFVAPHPGRPHYLNAEFNCLGDCLLGYGPDRDDRRRAPPAVVDALRVETSIAGPDALPAGPGAEWWLVATLPFDALAAFVGEPVAPAAGDTWRANAYACRGPPAPRHVVWHPIDAPAPDFHRPSDFGRLAFA